MRSTMRIVVKLGTQIVISEEGNFAFPRVGHVVDQIGELVRAGHDVIVVSSGAVGLGRGALGLLGRPLSLAEKQACAAVGQSVLMERYRDLFANCQLGVAQLLLAGDDFCDRVRYLNFQKTLEELLSRKFIPIINENDTVAVAELREDARTGFGDNDKLSALVAGKCGADLLVILSNVDGVYTANPALDPLAQRIAVIHGLRGLQGIQTQGQSSLGRGGMQAKLEAVRVAAMSGVRTFITSGLRKDSLSSFFAVPLEHLPHGTLVEPEEAGVVSSRKQWIGFASGYQGVVVVDDQAEKALTQRNASLLCVGIVSVQGEFLGGSVISVQNAAGRELGRGLTPFAASELRAVQGRSSGEMAGILSREPIQQEAIHRDDFVLFIESENGEP